MTPAHCSHGRPGCLAPRGLGMGQHLACAGPSPGLSLWGQKQAPTHALLGTGSYYQTTHKGEMKDDLFSLTLRDVGMQDNGVYSATFIGDSPLASAFFRLIVRGEGRGHGAGRRPDREARPSQSFSASGPQGRVGAQAPAG